MNSKCAYISALIILAILVSGVSAADNNLVNKNFGNKAFTIDIPSDSDFNKEANTNINLGDLKMNMEFFKNKGDNSKDLAMILYLKDSSASENVISEVIGDLEEDGDIVEENDNYLIVKNKNSNDFHLFDFDLEDIFNGLNNIIQSIFSQEGDVNVTTDDADVKVSNEGITIIDSDGAKISLSTDGLKVSDSKKGENVSISTKGLKVSDKGENVSISEKGVKVSGNGSDDSDNDSLDADISISEDMISNIDDADYSLCIKNQNNTQLIVLVGNNLDLMKSIAETASFTEN